MSSSCDNERLSAGEWTGLAHSTPAELVKAMQAET
jgi:hypothetical protein